METQEIKSKPIHRFISSDEQIVKATLPVEEMSLIIEHYHRVNRPVTKAQVGRIADDLRNDLWKSRTGNVIKFDDEGNLIDGQHRILAHILVGVPFTTNVIFGLPKEAILFTDRSLTRPISVNSVLLEHTVNGTVPTKSDFKLTKLRLSVAKEVCKHSGCQKPTEQVIRKYAIDNKDALDFALTPVEYESARRPGYLSALVVYYSKDSVKAKEFRDAVGGDGINLSDGPVIRLRSFLSKSSIGGSQMKHDHWRTVGAIHAFHFGNPLTSIPPMKREWDF